MNKSILKILLLTSLPVYGGEYFVVHDQSNIDNLEAKYPEVTLIKNYKHLNTTLVKSSRMPEIEEALFIEANTVKHVYSKLNTYDSDTLIDYMTLPWGVKHINTEEAWSFSNRGAGVKVLVLDTGIDRNHPAISHKIIEAKDFTETKVFKSVPYVEYDVAGHGTHVAATVLGNGNGLLGVAPDADLYVGKICVFDCENFDKVVAGLNWAIEKNVDVINMSLSYGKFPAKVAEHILNKIEEQNIVVVAAAGNKGLKEKHELTFPAKFPTVLSVGAVDNKNMIADFSSYGPNVKVVAPGVDIVSASLTKGINHRPNLLRSLSGTSMASPHVTGIAALVRGVNPRLQAKEVREIIINSAKLPEGAINTQNQYGRGLVDAAKSVKAALLLK